jgi:mRNA-degrading endonuclease RelE of RelBE toxin-antitoxin system
MYTIKYASTRISRELDKIDPSKREKFIKEIEAEIVKPLNKDIRLLEEFKKKNPKRFRLKYHDYRIIFSRDKKSQIITIYEITLRKDAYR